MPTLIEELPYAYVITTPKRCQVCHYCCGSVGKGTLRRCSGCRFAHYCNEACQRSAWKDHALECKLLKMVYPKVPTGTTRMIARIIAKQQIDDAPQRSESKRTFQMLESHVNEIQNDSLRMEHFTCICGVLKEYTAGEQLPPVSELLEIFGKLCINSFTMISSNGETIGMGLYLELSALDHSCTPDAVVVFDGQKAILNSIKNYGNPDVVDYKTVKISYIDIVAPSSERKQQLKEQYYFKCACSRCTDPLQDQLIQALRCQDNDCDGCVISATGDTGTCEKCGFLQRDIEPGITMMQRIQWQLEKLDALHKKQDFMKIYELSMELLKEAENVLHSVNIFYMRLADRACEAAEQLEMWPQAAELAKAAVLGCRLHYPRGYPAITYLLGKVGKTLQFLGRLEEAESYLQQAYDAAMSSHGDKHSLTNMISRLLSDCREERRVHFSQGQLT